MIDYSYDELSRLIEADYNNGATVYNYGYDVAGNMVNYDGVSRIFNDANQMTNDGTNTLTYDNNGNLTGNGIDTYVWDRANRLLSVGNHSYVYDGLGNRVQQTVSSVVTDYLNDVQPGLTKLLKQDDGTNVERFAHGVRGIHAVDDGTDWNFFLQDGLGSVRAVVDDMAVVQSSMSFDPYGNPMASYDAGFGFTGEQTDANGSVFLRARYYEPSLGVFSALDPFEGVNSRPMSMNGYSWVEGNPVMNVDPSGEQPCPNECSQLAMAGLPPSVYSEICPSPAPDTPLVPSSLLYRNWSREVVNQIQSVESERTCLSEIMDREVQTVPAGSTLIVDTPEAQQQARAITWCLLNALALTKNLDNGLRHGNTTSRGRQIVDYVLADISPCDFKQAGYRSPNPAIEAGIEQALSEYQYRSANDPTDGSIEWRHIPNDGWSE